MLLMATVAQPVYHKLLYEYHAVLFEGQTIGRGAPPVNLILPIACKKVNFLVTWVPKSGVKTRQLCIIEAGKPINCMWVPNIM